MTKLASALVVLLLNAISLPLFKVQGNLNSYHLELQAAQALEALPSQNSAQEYLSVGNARFKQKDYLGAFFAYRMHLGSSVCFQEV